MESERRSVLITAESQAKSGPPWHWGTRPQAPHSFKEYYLAPITVCASRDKCDASVLPAPAVKLCSPSIMMANIVVLACPHHSSLLSNTSYRITLFIFSYYNVISYYAS